MKTVVVIPCYNEERRLPVADFEAYLQSSDVHLLFVNDGSRDHTDAVLAAVQKTKPDQVSVLNEKVNRGKAEAVRVGINFALERGCDYVGYWDADLATPLGDIELFRQVLEGRPDLEIVFGARVKLLGRYVQRNPVRHYLGRVFATSASIVLNLAIYDTQCGAKLFRVATLPHSVFATAFLSRWIFDVEILARYIREVGSSAAEQRIYEYPLERWVDVAGSKIKSTDFFVAFRDLVRIRLNYFR